MRLGVKAHWRDASEMAALAREEGCSVLEVHLAPEDLYRDLHRVREVFAPLRDEFALVVHAPEFALAPGMGIPLMVNLASPHLAVRVASVRVLDATVALAAELRAEAVVLHPGGATRPGEAPQGAVEHLRQSLKTVDWRVPGYLENMPAHYHFRDVGQGTSALGLMPSEFTPLAPLVDGLCLDVCHAALARPEGSPQVAVAFADLHGHRVRHVHASGARVPAGEGVPPGAPGDILTPRDLQAVAARVHPEAVWVPEVWGGHERGGKTFRYALQYLKKHLPEAFV